MMRALSIISDCTDSQMVRSDSPIGQWPGENSKCPSSWASSQTKAGGPTMVPNTACTMRPRSK